MIPATRSTPVIRTDFSNNEVWEELRQRILTLSPEGWGASVEFVDDVKFSNVSVPRILSWVPEDCRHMILIIADSVTFRESENPLLVVHSWSVVSKSFRVVPEAIQVVENNLSLGNLDIGDFARAAGVDGIFRGR